MPIILNSRDLIVNNTKTEEYTARQNTDEWKKYKLLGSYVGTETDIKNRKEKLFNAADQLKEMFMQRLLPYSTKVKAFNTYLTRIFITLNFGHLLKLWSRVSMHSKGKCCGSMY